MQRSMSTHSSLWQFLEELVSNVIVPMEVVVKQINKGHTQREPMRGARLLRAERQNSYEVKLTSNEWTPTKSLIHFFKIINVVDIDKCVIFVTT